MNTRENSWSRTLAWMSLARLALLVAAGLAITGAGLPQALTGPLVNALLLLTVIWAGVPQAILVGMVTPLGAALNGILPLPLWIMIPFIALGNAILVSVFGALCARSRWLALGLAAALKFAWLAAAVTWLVARPLQLLIGGTPQAVLLPPALVQMMTWPQLATALAGGLIAFGVIALERRR